MVDECAAVLKRWRPLLWQAVRGFQEKAQVVATPEDLMAAAQYACWKAHEDGVTAPALMRRVVDCRLIDYLREQSPVSRLRYRKAADNGSTSHLYPVSLNKGVGHNRDQEFQVLFSSEVEIDPLEQAEANERAQMLHAAIDRLPPQARAVARRRLAGDTLKEIGERLGVTDARIWQIWHWVVVPRLRELLEGKL